MSEPETLPQLYFETGKIHERLAKGEKIELQTKGAEDQEWLELSSRYPDPQLYRFLRERPREKTAEEANLALEKDWLQAKKDGKPFDVEFQNLSGDSAWHPDPAPTFYLEHLAYRRRPAPKTPEQLRVEANLALKAEWEKAEADGNPFAVEARDTNRDPNGAWHDAAPIWVDSCEYRRKPEPEYVPWSYAERCGFCFRHRRGGFSATAPLPRGGSAVGARSSGNTASPRREADARMRGR